MRLNIIRYCLLATVTSSAAFAQTGYTTVFGGGSFYKTASYNVPDNIAEVETSGFTEVDVWNIAVSSNCDLNFNGDFPIVTGGVYVGDTTYPNFASDMATLKQGSVRRITFSLGSSNTGTFQSIKALVDSTASGGGTSSSSILYKNFMALKKAIPALDAIDFDDENSYDTTSTVLFAEMLGNMGLKVMPDAYTNSSYWINVVAQINDDLPGTVDGVHLQAYAGGDGNNPCSGWNFGAVPVFPGLGSSNSGVAPSDSPSQVNTQMSSWHSQCGVTGGFMWIYDDFVGSADSYASAINGAVGN